MFFYIAQNGIVEEYNGCVLPPLPMCAHKQSKGRPPGETFVVCAKLPSFKNKGQHGEIVI